MSEDENFSFAVVFKNGKMTTQVAMGMYSPMKYQITSVEKDGNSEFSVFCFPMKIPRIRRLTKYETVTL